MLKGLKILVMLFTVPFLYSCQNPAQAQEVSFDKTVYVQAIEVRHTKHVRKQQHKICDRLKKIGDRLEKRKKSKKKDQK